MSPNISCLIYDMDGLLLDTEGIYTEVTQQIVGEYGKVFDWSVKEKIIGRRAVQAAEIIVESLDLPITPQDYLDSRKNVLLEKFKDTAALPGAKEMTTHFFDLGIPQALATSSSSPMFEAKFEKHKKWFSQFTQIIRGDDPELKEVSLLLISSCLQQNDLGLILRNVWFLMTRLPEPKPHWRQECRWLLYLIPIWIIVTTKMHLK